MRTVVQASDTGSGTLDLREQIVRIDRSIAETEKLQAETREYVAETMRLDRERWWFPWLQIATSLLSSGVIAVLVAALVAHWR